MTVAKVLALLVCSVSCGVLAAGTEIIPLLRAVNSGDASLVQALLEAGADPDDPKSARSPLISAITQFRGRMLVCDRHLVLLLLKHGADPNRPDPMVKSSPLHIAFELGDVQCATVLRDAGARIDNLDSRGYTIVTAAVQGAVATSDVGVLDTAISWGSR